MKKLYGTTFCGNEASDYAIENGYLDYGTFAKAFDAVLNNNIIGYGDSYEWENVNMPDFSDEIEEWENKEYEFAALAGKATDYADELFEDENTEKAEYFYKLADYYKSKEEEACEEKYNLEDWQEPEVFQWFIVSDNGADLIQRYTDDPLYYNGELDMYLWGVTHWGTSWDYVLTDVKLNCGEDAFKW